MAEIGDLNTTDASNTARFPENMAPGAVNDGARALEGLLARGFTDAVESDLTSGGSSNAYTLTPNRTLSAYYTGMRFQFKASFANTGAATLNVSSIDPKNIYKPTSSGLAALESGDIRSNQIVDVYYDGTQFALLSPIGQDGVLREGTEQATTSGTAINFTSIPSWVKKITIMLVGVSTDGTDNWLVQIGDSGGLETTGYLGASSFISTAVNSANFTTGFGFNTALAAGVVHGTLTLSLEDSANNTWVAHGLFARSDLAATFTVAGSKSLSATLDRLTLTTTGGSDAFDAGAINILYE